MDGLQRLRARARFLQPQSSKEAIQDLEDLASPVGAFVRDRCQLGSGLTVETDALYKAYRQWCDDYGAGANNKSVFGRDLRAVRPEIKVRRLGAERDRAYIGIAMVTP